MFFTIKNTKTLLFLSMFLLFSCGRGVSLPSEAKTEIDRMSNLIVCEKTDEFISGLLNKYEFEEKIYPHLPEAKQRGPVPADDYWMISTSGNKKAIDYFLNSVKNKKLKYLKAGRAEKKKKSGRDITIYNHIPVYFTDEAGEVIVFENLFESVVCTDSFCKVWSLGSDD